MTIFFHFLCYYKFGDNMKKYLKILGVAIIFGGLLAYLFYYDINKEVRAISKKEEVVTLFQVGVFKDYNNASAFSETFPSSLIYKDNDYYRVIIAISYHEETKLKLESIYQNSEIEYYEKEISCDDTDTCAGSRCNGTGTGICRWNYG